MAIFVNPSTGKMEQVADGGTASAGFINLDTYKPGTVTPAPAVTPAPTQTTTPAPAATPRTPAPVKQTTAPTPTPTTPVTPPVATTAETFNKTEIIKNIQDSYNKATGAAKANEAFINAVARATLGRNASADELGKTANKQFSVIGMSLDDVLKRFDPQGKLLGATPGMGIQAPETTTDSTGSGKVAEPLKPLTVIEQKEQLIENYMGNKASQRDASMEKYNVDSIEGAITDASTIANDIMKKVEQMTSDLELKDILNEETQIQLKEKIEGRVIPMSMINRQLTSDMGKLTSEQRISRLYDVYSLNTMINAQNAATRNAQLAQGQYDRAMDKVKQDVDDWTEYQGLKLDLLTEMGVMEKEERAKAEAEIQYERSLMEQGYTYVQDTATYEKIVKELGVTAGTFSQFFYKDPTNNKIYLKPTEPTEDQILSISEAAALGVNYGTTVSQAAAMGINPADIAAARKKSSGAAKKPTSYIKDQNKLIGAGLSTTDISAINENLSNGYSLDEIINSSDFTPEQEKAVRDQFVEAPVETISTEDATTIISAAVDKEGNLDINKIPSDMRIEVLQKGREAGIFDEEDEDTKNWFEKAISYINPFD